MIASSGYVTWTDATDGAIRTPHTPLMRGAVADEVLTWVEQLSDGLLAHERISSRCRVTRPLRPVQLTRPGCGEQADNGGDRQQDDSPDDPP